MPVPAPLSLSPPSAHPSSAALHLGCISVLSVWPAVVFLPVGVCRMKTQQERSEPATAGRLGVLPPHLTTSRGQGPTGSQLSTDTVAKLPGVHSLDSGQDGITEQPAAPMSTPRAASQDKEATGFGKQGGQHTAHSFPSRLSSGLFSLSSRSVFSERLAMGSAPRFRSASHGCSPSRPPAGKESPATRPTAFQKLQMPKQEKAHASPAKTASTRAVAAGYSQALHVQTAQGVTGHQRFSRDVEASRLVGPSSTRLRGALLSGSTSSQELLEVWRLCVGAPRCCADRQGHI